MKRLFAACIAAFVVAVPAQGQDRMSVVPQGCTHLYSQPYYRILARQAIKRDAVKLDQSKINHLGWMRHCSRSPQAHRNMLVYTRGLFAYRRMYLEYLRLTPYVCARGFRSPIPCWIVYRESGPPGESVRSRWLAHNPSGASGPFQLLGWGAIYPALTFAAQLQNIRIAAWLWNGGVDSSDGKGPHNWACC